MPWHGFKAVIPALLKTFIKQAEDTETNTKLATRTFWVKVYVHIKKRVGAAAVQTVCPHLFASHVSSLNG